jgi:nitroimidazol reductase NimA-like FMN-containing flavoprotein (pyridoxamine 5'-phosphate oxidase superfamily)
MLGELTREEKDSFLRTEQIGRLGVQGDGRVYVYPINFGYDGTFVYLQSHEGLKLWLMRAHPEVCLEVDEIVSPADWRSVMVHGAFEELTDDNARRRAMALIAAQGTVTLPPSTAPYVGGHDALVCYRIHITEKTGRYERDEVFPQRTAVPETP